MSKSTTPKSGLKKNESVSQLIERIAPILGAKTYVEPRYKRYGMIFFKNGRMMVFKKNSLNINMSTSVSITINKYETNVFLKYLGYNVSEGKTFSKIPYDVNHNRGLDDGYKYALEIGFPVILKPNNKSQGVLVCKVSNKKEYYSVAKKILKQKGEIMLVEKYYGEYSDFRIVVLNGEIISAYQRLQLYVVGNGEDTILELLRKKQDYFETIDRPRKEINVDDFRIKMNLKLKGITLDYVPMVDEKVVLLTNSNLSSGGTTLDLGTNISTFFKEIAISISKKMNLNLCGIDILAHDITNEQCKDYLILEINSAPGLDNYAYSGEKQKKNVDDLYIKVLNFVEHLGE